MPNLIYHPSRVLYSTLSKSYLHVLERVLVPLYRRPDIAVRSAVNTFTEPTPERVISNFMQGLFLLGKDIDGGFIWGSTPERAVITPDSAHLRKRLKQYMKKGRFEIRTNEEFDRVIRACQRKDEKTWINEPIIDLYSRLHELGYGKSMEAYEDGELVGGLWGLQIGSTYSIMSMFHRRNHAGSIVMGHLVRLLKSGELTLIDCGLMTPNFKRFGAHPVSTGEFTTRVVNSISTGVGDQKKDR